VIAVDIRRIKQSDQSDRVKAQMLGIALLRHASREQVEVAIVALGADIQR